MNKKKIGQKIKEIRQEKGLSQSEFGVLIDNADKSLVSKWERGLSMPNNARLKIISDIGHIDVSDLINDSLTVNNTNNSDKILQEFDDIFDRYISLQKMEQKNQIEPLLHKIDINTLKTDFFNKVQYGAIDTNTQDINELRNKAMKFIDNRLNEIRNTLPKTDSEVLQLVKKDIANLTETLKSHYFNEQGDPKDIPELNLETYKKIDYVLKNTLFDLVKLEESNI